MTTTDIVLDVVAREMGVDRASILSPSRGVKRIAEARQVAMYLLQRATGWSWSEVGRALGRDRTTVRHGAEKVGTNPTDLVKRMEAQIVSATSAL